VKRKRWSISEYRPASASWQSPSPCGYCRKRSYPDRRSARRALRALYPDAVGTQMNAYRCPNGGTGWHLGGRHVWPSWTDNRTAPIDCDRCPTVIHIGRPVAHLHGLRLCADCGDQAEHAAITADRNRDTDQQEEEESA
jgi:hypothetical protein